MKGLRSSNCARLIVLYGAACLFLPECNEALRSRALRANVIVFSGRRADSSILPGRLHLTLPGDYSSRARTQQWTKEAHARLPIRFEPVDRAFVFTQYAGYLRRDADIGGFIFWLGQVNGAALRDVPRQHAMVCSFITSVEYQQRFSSVVTHTNAESAVSWARSPQAQESCGAKQVNPWISVCALSLFSSEDVRHRIAHGSLDG